MKKTMTLFTIAGLSMASEFDGVADNDLHLYKLQNGITALVHTVDDELRVLPIGYHPGSSNGPRVVFTDDELRVLPIDYHPPRPRPSGPIWTDDELRILPIDHHTRPNTKPNKPIMADDDDELLMRALPLDYIPGGTRRPRTVFAEDDELRVLPIDYHPGSQGGPRVIYADDDDELRVLPIDYHPGTQRPHVIYADDDDELRVLPIDYHPGTQRPHVIYADDDDEFRVLPIDYHPPRQTRPNRPIMADDDEFRAIPSAYTHAMSKYGKKDKKPVPEGTVQNDDELRLIAVGPGSLSHKKNTTETAKPVNVKPKRFTTGAVKLNTTISNSSADDEMRFAHFIPQYRPRKEDVGKKVADNTLVELSDLLVESQRDGGFLPKRR